MDLIPGPYTKVPDLLNLTDQHLQYLDALIYASLWSFNNTAEDKCFPMHETIGKRAGMSKRFVIGSIKRLEDAGLITVERSEQKKVSNKYFFNLKQGKFFHRTEKIPLTLFDASDLTANEKAMMICLRQFYNCGRLMCLYTVCKFAQYLGLSYDTVKKQYSSLKKKGYIAEKIKLFKNSNYTHWYSFFTDKLNWDYYDAFVPPTKKTYLPIIVG